MKCSTGVTSTAERGGVCKKSGITTSVNKLQYLPTTMKWTHDMDGELKIMIDDLVKYKKRILARAHAITPDVRWDGRREKVDYIKG